MATKSQLLLEKPYGMLEIPIELTIEPASEKGEFKTTYVLDGNKQYKVKNEKGQVFTIKLTGCRESNGHSAARVYLFSKIS